MDTDSELKLEPDGSTLKLTIADPRQLAKSLPDKALIELVDLDTSPAADRLPLLRIVGSQDNGQPVGADHMAQLTLEAAQALSPLSLTARFLLRVWEQAALSGDPSTEAGALRIGAAGQKHVLKDGLEISFKDATYSPGDYWLVPARRRCNLPLTVPGRSVAQLRYARLALVPADPQ